ncbi:MAG: sensor histidine kinase, partial [Halobaculum sp.]
MVSHDLRNPLNLAQGRAELLGEQIESEHYDPLVRALDRMEAIIEDTLTLARNGDTIDETTALSLTTFAERCWETTETEGGKLETVGETTIQG